MKHIEGNFKSGDNINLYYQGWLPSGEIKAILFVVHGLGEHSGRYSNIVNYFVPLGYAVYTLDLEGHGKSEGSREYVDRFEDFTNSLNDYYSMVKSWQNGKPTFLLGHSMGGLIASYYLLDHQEDFDGAIISAPLTKVGEDITKFTVTMGKILSVITPKAGLLTLDATGVSRDPKVVSDYVNDPLVFHGKTPARTAAELLKAMMRVTAESNTIKLPFIVVQGSDDKLVDPDGARMLYDQASSKDKTIKIYDGMYHEVFNEPDRARVLGDVEAWLKSHVAHNGNNPD